MYVITDVCFCEYTSHGHCGVLCEGDVHNDLTLENLKKQAIMGMFSKPEESRASLMALTIPSIMPEDTEDKEGKREGMVGKEE